ncbi:glycerol-3-phosphate phosphatase [Hemicordylus capensis]|uniref:glycerol-3-phosphate phosphatase n=1 Tax=Hemicordylus capensis TaxID=884348 RepID=UPI0023027E93|nr:glycerol-3-phosphate phosphatase [Hemicordylus capensis]
MGGEDARHPIRARLSAASANPRPGRARRRAEPRLPPPNGRLLAARPPRPSANRRRVSPFPHRGRLSSSSSSVRRRQEAAAMAQAKQCRRLEPGLARSVLAGVEAVLFDCDGVLWRGEAAVPGAAEALGRLAAEGGAEGGRRRLLCYVTNNSSRTRGAYVEKLRRLGFPPAEPRQVFGSAYCAARYLRRALPPGAAAYVLGGAALSAELEAAGVAHLGAGPEAAAAAPEQEASAAQPPPGSRAPLDPSVRAVLVGYDEHFSYAKLCLALRYLLRGDGDCLLVGTNRDHRLPLEGGSAVPGTGCLVKAVETAAEREAFIIGKPSDYIFECVANEFNIDPARTIMVGDRLDTDILMGNNCGLKTLLTLTGVTTLEEVKDHLKSDCPKRKNLVPDYYVDSIADLLPALQD